MKSAYQRGYEAARDDAIARLRMHNAQVVQRLAGLTGLVDNAGRSTLTEYDRGVLNGAITANRTMLMELGELKGEGTGEKLLGQLGD